MKPRLELLDVVALLVDVPENHVAKGQVGTVVELLKNNFMKLNFAIILEKPLPYLLWKKISFYTYIII